MPQLEIRDWLPPSNMTEIFKLVTQQEQRSCTHKANLSIAQLRYLANYPHQSLGRHHTEEAKRKMRKRQVSPEARNRLSEIAKLRTGINSSMYGKHHSEETRAKLREKAITRWQDPKFREKMEIAQRDRPEKISKIQKANWQNPAYRAKVVPACLKSRRPTNLEAKLTALITKYSLPYKYTGDGSFIIGNLNPDFVNVNGEKIAIEVFGGHWHKDKTNPLRTEEGRRAILKEYGWRLIVIWGDELKSLSEDAILEKIGRGQYAK